MPVWFGIPAAVWLVGGAATVIGGAYAYGSSQEAGVGVQGDYNAPIDLGPVAYYGFLAFGAFLAWKAGSAAIKSFRDSSPAV